MKTIKSTLWGLATAAIMTACGSGEVPLTLSGLCPADFDTLINEKPVALYTLKNANGMEVCITNFGGRVVSVMVPDRNGKMTDVVLGYDNIAQYADAEHSPSDFGASIGRYANRINQGKIKVDGVEYQLPQNNFGHCLHGGPTGWQYQVYDAQLLDDHTLKLTLVSPDGDNGFPGTVTATTTYTVTEDNSLAIVMEATTDKTTVVNMTNHSYFNLNGTPEQNAMDMVLYINADQFTPSDSTYMTTGEILPVDNTPMDFRQPHAIRETIGTDYDQLKNAMGYDHNWVLNTKGDDTQVAASLYSEQTGILLEMFTNEPGVQVYTGNFQGINGEIDIPRKLGKHYPQQSSVCLESQKYPDSPNKMEQYGFPNPYLKPGETYRSTVTYKFSIK